MAFRDDLRSALRLRGPLSRRTYFTAGVTLTLVKYVIDAAVIYSLTGIVWRPTDYVGPLVTLGGGVVTAFPTGLSVALLLWTLPFLWFGVTITVRRAIDAGLSGWISVAFFLPVLNYILMLALVAAPSAPARPVVSQQRPEPLPGTGLLDRNAILAVAAGAVSVMGAMLIAIVWLKSYGLTTFLGTPFLMGLVIGVVSNVRRERSTSQTMTLVGIGLAMAGVALVAVAFEGIVCLVMALPLAVPLALLGGRRRTVDRRDTDAGGRHGDAAGDHAGGLVFRSRRRHGSGPRGHDVDRRAGSPVARVAPRRVVLGHP